MPQVDQNFLTFVLLNWGPLGLIALGFGYFIYRLVTVQMPAMQDKFAEKLEQQQAGYFADLKEQRTQFLSALATQSAHAERIITDSEARLRQAVDSTNLRIEKMDAGMSGLRNDLLNEIKVIVKSPQKYGGKRTDAGK